MIITNFNMSTALPEAILIFKCKKRAQNWFFNLLHYNQNVREKGCGYIL